MQNGISGTGIAILAGGSILLWSALKGASITSTLRQLLAGTQPTGVNVNPIAIAPPSANLNSAAVNPNSNPGNAPSTSGGNQPSASTTGPVQKGSYQAYAMALLTLNGWAGQWTAFNNIEMHEAGWNPTIKNPHSGAFGIAQAYLHGKGAATQGTMSNMYGGYVSDSVAKSANSGNGYAQLQWMMAYIKSRYGSPNAAWAQYNNGY